MQFELCIATGFTMVAPEGFEPPTFWFVAKRSIQLSYRVNFNKTYYILSSKGLSTCNYLFFTIIQS